MKTEVKLFGRSASGDAGWMKVALQWRWKLQPVAAVEQQQLHLTGGWRPPALFFSSLFVCFVPVNDLLCCDWLSHQRHGGKHTILFLHRCSVSFTAVSFPGVRVCDTRSSPASEEVRPPLVR